MKIAFFWTWEFSKNILTDLIENYSWEVCIDLVVSQPDKAIGRKKVITPTAVKQYAGAKNITVLQPSSLKENTSFFNELTSRDLDFIVVVAYWKIVPVEVLEAAKKGCINIHGSILPAYRWASPIQESIKLGNTKTGLTIMYMSKGMDEWDILSTLEVNIWRDDTSEDIFKKFETSWASLLVDTLKKVESWEITEIKQDGRQATYCSKIQKSDGEISWNVSAKEIYAQYRAYTPWPWIFTYLGGKKFSIESCDYEDATQEIWAQIGQVIMHSDDFGKKVWIVTGSGILVLKEIKLEWKKTMDILSFVNGNKDFIGHIF